MFVNTVRIVMTGAILSYEHARKLHTKGRCQLELALVPFRVHAWPPIID